MAGPPDAAKEHGPLGVPMRIRNAPTALMNHLGYAKGYRYPHAEQGHWIAESYLPDGIPADERLFYRPSVQGREHDLSEAHRRRTKGFYEQGGAPDGEGPPEDRPAS